MRRTGRYRWCLAGSVLLWLLVSGQVAAESVAYPELTGLEPPTDISIGWTFTPDGLTVFWTGWNGRWGAPRTSLKTIYVSHWRKGRWTAPVAAPFSGQFNDDDPYVSPDGRCVLFSSDRPAPEPGLGGGYDIWSYALSGETGLQWLPISSADNDYSPVVTAAGNVYFTSGRAGSLGQADIYRVACREVSCGSVQRLDEAVNSRWGEWNLWVSADEQDMLFESSGRPTNLSAAGDLYYSYQSAAGWTPAIPVSALNGPGSDLLPRLHPGGVRLYYSRVAMGGHSERKQLPWPALRAGLRAAAGATD